MLDQRETPDSVKAGILSVTVHVLLLGALLISFNWKTTHPTSIAQVELWDTVATVTPPPMPKPVQEEIPQPEPMQPIPEPEPQAKIEPAPEIAVEKKMIEPPKKVPEKKAAPKPAIKVEDERKKLLEQLRREDLSNQPKEAAKQSTDAIKKLQQELLNEDKAGGDVKSAVSKTAASPGVVDEFKAKIQSKIRSHVNKTLCGEGNPELKFEIGLIPSGELSSNPRLVKSSGNPVCDEAVERAIRLAEPLPLPSDPALFSQFRNLKLTFRPNDQ